MAESSASREMTLKEYVEQLPSIHLARREYNKLGEIVRALCEIVTVPSDEVIEIDKDGNVTPAGAKVLRDPGP